MNYFSFLFWLNEESSFPESLQVGLLCPSLLQRKKKHFWFRKKGRTGKKKAKNEKCVLLFFSSSSLLKEKKDKKKRIKNGIEKRILHKEKEAEETEWLNHKKNEKFFFVLIFNFSLNRNLLKKLLYFLKQLIKKQCHQKLQIILQDILIH